MDYLCRVDLLIHIKFVFGLLVCLWFSTKRYEDSTIGLMVEVILHSESTRVGSTYSLFETMTYTKLCKSGFQPHQVMLEALECTISQPKQFGP